MEMGGSNPTAVDVIKVGRALISVSDKTGVIDFAKGLVELGCEIISTGGTFKALRDAGVPAIRVDEVTGFPEVLDGRVKTLHPAIHAGILAIRGKAEHEEQLAKLGIKPIDLVVVNLYPFEATVAKPGVSLEDAIENIDIGGPTMIRSAAKNSDGVAVITSPARYGEVLEELRATGGISRKTRMQLALEAFLHTAKYDGAIYDFLRKRPEIAGDAASAGFPEIITLTYRKAQDLRYGENPHQKAAFYVEPNIAIPCISRARQLWGKELSFNNINDANACLEILAEFDEPAAVAVKHANPCGVGCGASVLEAYRKAYKSDPVSIFGGIVAVNRPVDEATARELSSIFLEIVMAPSFDEASLSILTQKKNLRILEIGDISASRSYKGYDLKKVVGGLLVQDRDVEDFRFEDAKVVTRRQPTEAEWKDMLFGWKVVKHVKSNAIVLARDGATIGVGAGQMNRVGAARIAIEQAGEKARGSVLASDAFFPMRDTVDAAGKAGVTAIIQPGGSIKDEDSIKAADEYGIAMVFTGVRHFRH